jgi:hypothetical protein
MGGNATSTESSDTFSPSLFDAWKRPRVIDQDLPHHAGRHRQKAVAVVEVRAARSEQADITFTKTVVWRVCAFRSPRIRQRRDDAIPAR